MSKRRILEIYLNVIEWGNGVFGAEAAIRYYYGVSASSITAEQAARLAAMVPNPRFYDRNRNTPWLLRKTDIILSRMAPHKFPDNSSPVQSGNMMHYFPFTHPPCHNICSHSPPEFSP